MERVTGIGGLFFRASDPMALARCYQDHHTDYFGRPAQPWIVNFRVRDLTAMVAQLEAAGILVTVDAEQCPDGRFARV